MTAALSIRGRVAIDGQRSPAPEDAPKLAALMLDAYRGTVDAGEETAGEALVEVLKTFDGEYGAFMRSCSRVVQHDNELVSATLLTRWKDRPFVAFAMTAPGWKRRGLARASMINAMQEVLARGDDKLGLVVTVTNTPAFNLYQSLGFQRGR